MKIINKEFVVYLDFIWSLTSKNLCEKYGVYDFYKTTGNLNPDQVFDNMKQFLKLLFKEKSLMTFFFKRMCGLFITFHHCLNHPTFVDLLLYPELCAPDEVFDSGPSPGRNYATSV